MVHFAAEPDETFGTFFFFFQRPLWPSPSQVRSGMAIEGKELVAQPLHHIQIIHHCADWTAKFR